MAKKNLPLSMKGIIFLPPAEEELFALMDKIAEETSHSKSTRH